MAQVDGPFPSFGRERLDHCEVCTAIVDSTLPCRAGASAPSLSATGALRTNLPATSEQCKVACLRELDAAERLASFQLEPRGGRGARRSRRGWRRGSPGD